MSPERHVRKSELFLQAVELSGRQQQEFLDEACADDPELRREIERMLALDQTSFLEEPALGTEFQLKAVQDSAAAAPASDAPDAAETHTVIGNYRILGVLGEGGMGVVYRAEQINPRRPVALKVLRPGVADRDSIRRFELEAQVLGRLQHSNIAHVYEAGSFQDARGEQPFLAMELIDGLPLPEYLNQCSPNVRERLALMLQICDAVEHAHQRGVIHRDLKPANILVQQSGQVKVLDFGIARVTADDWQATLVTNRGQLLGTLAYMSPEQLEFDSADIDTRADVYALGVILYELLTGALPRDLHGKSLVQVVQIMREDQPKPLSATDRSLRGDLSVIADKALERDRTQRYASVGDLAADLRRYLAGEPIAAQAHTTWYHLRTFARRNRSLVGATIAIMLVLVAGLAGTLWHLTETQRAHRQTERARAEAVAARDEERLRSEQLQQVADFQAAMLRDIDVHLMGMQLREDLLEEFRAVHGQPSEVSDAELVDEVQEEFERYLIGINFTTAAQMGLQRNVFDRAIEAIERDLGDQPLIKARLLQSIADSLESLDLSEQAMHVQEQALAIRRETLGDEHPDTLTSVLGRGYLLLGAGRYAEAEAHYNEALEGRKRVLGEEHPDTLLVKRRMAGLYRMTGRVEEAVESGRAALKGLQRALGDDDLRTIDALHTMAPLMHGAGDLEAAREYNRLALEGRRRLLGDDHPDTLISLNNMGIILASQGRIDEAIPYLEEALEARLRVLGRTHRLTLQSMANLARGLARLGRYDEAESITREVLERHVRMFGEQHHHTLSTMRNLGDILMDAGRFDDAAEHVKRTLDVCRVMLGDHHIETLSSFVAMHRLLHEMERFDEAVALGEEMLQLAYEALPADHPLRSIMMTMQGRTLAALNRFVEAEPFMLEAHRALTATFGSEHGQSRRAAQQIIDFYSEWRDFDANAEVDERLADWRAAIIE